MLNKKGLSTIVVTVILVALVLVAVGIVWAVVSGVLTNQRQGIDAVSWCVNTEVRATSVTCTSTPAGCVVRLERGGLETHELGGVKLVFKEANLTTSTVLDPAVGDIPTLVGETTNSQATGLTDPTRVEVTPYYIDANGDQRLCTQTSVFNF